MSDENTSLVSESQQFSRMTIPEGCDPIREAEFERLPDYAIELITQSMNGMLENVTRDQLLTTLTNFFENSSNVEICNSDPVIICESENEFGRGSDSATCGTVHPFEQ